VDALTDMERVTDTEGEDDILNVALGSETVLSAVTLWEGGSPDMVTEVDRERCNAEVVTGIDSLNVNVLEGESVARVEDFSSEIEFVDVLLSSECEELDETE